MLLKFSDNVLLSRALASRRAVPPHKYRVILQAALTGLVSDEQDRPLR